MKAMILAAGRGTRMRPLTDYFPKPLLKVAGVPLIEHHISRLADSGFKEIVINLCYRGEQIRKYLGSGERWAVKLRYSFESPALETGGGIFQALPLLVEDDDSFIVVNGDIWTDLDYGSLPDSIDGLAHLVMVKNPSHNPTGDFCLADGRVINGESDEGESMTFSGVSVLKSTLWASQTSGKYPLAPLLRAAIDKGQVTGSCHKGYWIDVGTLERLKQLNSYLLEAGFNTDGSTDDSADSNTHKSTDKNGRDEG